MDRLHTLLRRGVGAVSLVMIVLSLGAGPRIGPAAAAPQRQGTVPVTLRVAMPAPASLDPVQVSRFDPNTRDLVENLFVGLTRFDPLTQQVEPMLAKEWSVSADGLTWTFTLRDDIQWVRYYADQQQVVAVRPVVAGDFVYAVQRACDPLRLSPVTANLMIVRGCQTVANAFPEVIDDLFIAREIGVRATSPTTLEIDLLFPAGYFPTLLTTPEFRPLPREAVSDSGVWTVPSTILSDGPFALAGQDSAGLTLRRNPFWPDSPAGNVEQVDVTFTGESLSAVTLANSGRVDLARLDASESGAASASSLFHAAPGNSLTVLGFSFDRAIVSTADARRALALGIDRRALAEQFFAGREQAVDQFTPQGLVASPQFGGLTFDPAQAQAALAAAGYEGCNQIPEKMIILVPDDDPVWAEVGQFLISQWSINLGCAPALFEVQALPRTLMIELAHATYDTETVTRSPMWLTVWSADYPDANAWVSDALHCRYGYIKTGRACDAADTLLDQAATEGDAARRADLYRQAEEQFFGAAGSFPVIPLLVTNSAWLQQPWLSGVNEYGPARYDLWTLDTAAQSK